MCASKKAVSRHRRRYDSRTFGGIHDMPRSGQNDLVIVTGTASGKPIVALLPLLAQTTETPAITTHPVSPVVQGDIHSAQAYHFSFHILAVTPPPGKPLHRIPRIPCDYLRCPVLHLLLQRRSRSEDIGQQGSPGES